MPALTDFRRPYDIARHPTLEPEVKRAIFASWASDSASQAVQQAKAPHRSEEI